MWQGLHQLLHPCKGTFFRTYVTQTQNTCTELLKYPHLLHWTKLGLLMSPSQSYFLLDLLQFLLETSPLECLPGILAKKITGIPFKSYASCRYVHVSSISLRDFLPLFKLGVLRLSPLVSAEPSWIQLSSEDPEQLAPPLHLLSCACHSLNATFFPQFRQSIRTASADSNFSC